MIKNLIGICILVSCCTNTHAAVGTQGISAGVVEVFSASDGLFGGCMAKLSPGPETLSISRSDGNACGAGYVTFDCDGSFGGSKSVGTSKYAVAQLAYVADKRVSVKVDSSKTAGGYCFADFIKAR